MVNWDAIDHTEPKSDLRLSTIKYYETNEGCDILGFFDGYYREQGYRVYCFTTKKQAKSLMERCINQERKTKND